MHWYSAVSNSPSLEIALEDVTREILKKLDGKNPDLGFVFISSHHSSEYEQITERIHKIESILLFLEWKDLESEFDLSIKKFNEIQKKTNSMTDHELFKIIDDKNISSVFVLIVILSECKRT